MSLAAKTYEWLTEQVRAANSADPLFNADVHETDFDAIVKSLTIRVGDPQSEPAPILGAIREFNGRLILEIVARPDNQTGRQRVEARERASRAALRIVELINEDERLKGTGGENRVCDARVAQKFDTWGNAGTVRHAVSRLLLNFNTQ